MLIFDQFKRDDRLLWFLTIGVTACMGILLAGLWYLQVVSSKFYKESQKNQSSRRIQFPGQRGKILDQNGVVIAENRPCYNINLYLEDLRDLYKDSYAQARGKRRLKLSEQQILGQSVRYQVTSNIVHELGLLLKKTLVLNESRFSNHYYSSLVLPLPVLEDISQEEKAVFMEAPARPPGLNLDIQPLRVYTNQSTASHIIGQLARSNTEERAEEDLQCHYYLTEFKGLVGIESAFDTALRGNPGVMSVLVNNLGYRQAEEIWVPSEPGSNIVLTLDLRIQRAAEKALMSHGQNTKGAIVVMDTRSGDVLAMASSPPYDPNLFVPRISPEEWMKLTDTNLNIALNRATYATYAPGSIFKVVIGLAALEFGNLNPAEIYHNKGYFSYGPRSRPIHDLAPAGEYDFRRAIVKSSNAYFVHCGLETGLEGLMEMASRLCLGQKTGIPLRQESSGFFPTPAWVERRSSQGAPVYPGDIGQLCIGQGAVAVTPLQMTVMAAAVANGGKVLWPRLVERILPPGPVVSLQDGRGIYFPPRGVRSELRVKPQHLDTLRKALLADVEDSKEGTGKKAMIPGFRISGKTGTAQFKQGGILQRHDVWFASFAPYENPRYAMVVLIEGGVSGGDTCAPLARMVYETIKDIETPKPPPAVGQETTPATEDRMLALSTQNSMTREN